MLSNYVTGYAFATLHGAVWYSKVHDSNYMYYKKNIYIPQKHYYIVKIHSYHPVLNNLHVFYICTCRVPKLGWHVRSLKICVTTEWKVLKFILYPGHPSPSAKVNCIMAVRSYWLRCNFVYIKGTWRCRNRQ